MNLDEIRAMNPNEVRKLSVEELLKAVYEGQTYQVWTAREQDEHGNWLRQAWNVHNAYDGNLVSLHEVTWTYWKPGVVKDIEVQVGNQVRTISHDEAGRVVNSRVAVAAEENLGDRIIGKLFGR
jgi:hypothetical protein